MHKVISDILVVNVFGKKELTAGFNVSWYTLTSLFCLHSVLRIRLVAGFLFARASLVDKT